MKNDEARQAMVKKAHATFEKYRTFSAVPELKAIPTDIETVAFPEAGLSQPRYVEGLYAICANGDLLGRHGGDLIGSVLADKIVQAQPSLRKGK